MCSILFALSILYQLVYVLTQRKNYKYPINRKKLLNKVIKLHKLHLLTWIHILYDITLNLKFLNLEIVVNSNPGLLLTSDSD